MDIEDFYAVTAVLGITTIFAIHRNGGDFLPHLSL